MATIRHKLLSGLLACSLAGSVAASDAPVAQSIGLRVAVDALGKVQSAQPADPSVVPALNQAAQEIALKLVFTPARKNGVAVASETSLSLTLALEQRADGQFGFKLKRATNGPGVLSVGKIQPPKSLQNGALIVVGIAVPADGVPDMASLKPQRVELRVPSTFAEARYLDAVTKSLQGTRFELDKVDGVVVPSQVSVPYMFSGGPKKAKPGESKGRGQDKSTAPEPGAPWLSAVSALPGIELAKIDFSAPLASAAK